MYSGVTRSALWILIFCYMECLLALILGSELVVVCVFHLIWFALLELNGSFMDFGYIKTVAIEELCCCFLIFLVHMLIGVWKGLKVDEITSDISRIIWRSKSITNGFVIVDLMIKNSGKVL